MTAQAEIPASDVTGMEAPIGYVQGPKDVHRPFAVAGEGDGSKWNALAHGLTAKKLFPVDLAAAVVLATAMFRELYRPTSSYEESLIVIMGRAAAQCEHARKLKIVNLQRLMDRAVLCWDADRRVWIQELGARLAADPLRVQEALRGTKQGVDWLLENWRGLSDALKANGEAGWTPDQTKLAFDLMGVRPELRDSSPKLPAGCTAKQQAAVVASEIEALEKLLKMGLRAVDHAAKEMAAVGMPMEEDEQTKRLRKYESKARLEFTRAQADLLKHRAAAASPAAPTATATAATTTTPTASAAAPASATAAASEPAPKGQGTRDKGQGTASATAPASEPTPASTTAAPVRSGPVTTGPAAASSPRHKDKPPTPRPVSSARAMDFLHEQSKMWQEDLIPREGAAASASAEPGTAPRRVSSPRTEADPATAETVVEECADEVDLGNGEAGPGWDPDLGLGAAEVDIDRSIFAGEPVGSAERSVPHAASVGVGAAACSSRAAEQRERRERRRKRAHEKEARKAARRRRR